MEKTDLSQQEFCNKAEAYCVRGERAASQIRRKLYEWGAEESYIDPIIRHLYTHNYLSNKRFCEAYIHDKVAYQGWGQMKIRAMLRGLGLPESVIESALQTIDQTEYNRQLQKSAQAKRNTSKEQQMRFLLQRGYTYDEINKTIGYE